MVDFLTVKNNKEINTYIKRADMALDALGYTEHSFAHVAKVADTVEYILTALDYDKRTVELGKIAAYLHDVGNLVNRVEHSQSGAIIAFRLLDRLGMDCEEIATVVGAIGNHDEGTGVPIDAVAAALIIGDKSDVRRSRVRNLNYSDSDIHDRVNYSVESSSILIDKAENVLILDIKIDTDRSSVMDYFEIFLERMILCKKASAFFGLDFKLVINSQGLS